ncbi:bifunctional DNA primase/polymerase [Streptomyces sp. NPDC050523]|uniref:bifunctional DNA primase/polymerase n=1 Tax=Streptomyces sp. NPDC050523 TaxID=3365622 RepID=UPI00378A2859
MRKTERKCARCVDDMPLTARTDARFCSTRCRVAAHRAAKTNPIPDELRTRDRWVRRSASKVPLTTAGKAASSTDPRTWATYDAACSSSAGTGTGFVLNGDGIVCLDLDHALSADGTPKPWAAEILRQAGATYVEVSASGDGLHIFGYADVRQGRRIRREGGYAVEVYGDGRYIAMTGHRFRGAPSTLTELSVLVGQLTA